VETLATWLQAEFYECTYRPVPLQEHLVFENGVYTYGEVLKARISPSETKVLKDPVTNAIVALAFGAVTEGHGVLVFCESRRRCEELSVRMFRSIAKPRADHILPHSACW
jgi:DNA polymerase theta